MKENENWKWVRLGDYAITEKGKKPKNLSKKRSVTYPVPYVNIKAFEKKEIDEYTDGMGCVLCEENDFLMVWDGSRSGYVGKAVKGALGSTLVRIKLPEVNHEYAYYFLQSKFVEINTRAKGVGIPHVDPNLLWNYKFPLPSIKEQQQIVFKIEELFSELDKGIEELKAAQQQLKVYRQAVLKWAFEGKLTNEWRVQQKQLPAVKDLLTKIKSQKANGKKAKELLPLNEEELDELFELPIGWEWEKNERYLFEVKDGTHDSPKYLPEGIPFVTQKNIRQDGLDFTNVQYISEGDHDKFYQRSNVAKGDILISMIGHNRGMTALVNSGNVFSIKNVGLFKFYPDVHCTKFSYYYYQSQIGLNLVLKKSKGGAQPFIGLTELRNWPVIVCSIEEQKQIVQEIESRLSVCDKMEETVTDTLKKAEALRQGILMKAFEGKLSLITENLCDV
jgi:type I restriction enzyme, S subunit